MPDTFEEIVWSAWTADDEFIAEQDAMTATIIVMISDVENHLKGQVPCPSPSQPKWLKKFPFSLRSVRGRSATPVKSLISWALAVSSHS